MAVFRKLSGKASRFTNKWASLVWGREVQLHTWTHFYQLTCCIGNPRARKHKRTQLLINMFASQQAKAEIASHRIRKDFICSSK